MNAAAFGPLLSLYTWFLLAAFIGFLVLIARFYQRFSGERTYYQLFLVPTVLLGIESVRQTRLQMVTDQVSLILSAAAGILLVALSVHLYWRMTRGRSAPSP